MRLEFLIAQFAYVFASQPVQLVHVEARVVTENLRQIKTLDDLRQRQLLAIVLGRPAEQAEIVHHRRRQITAVHVSRKRRALVALAHLGTILVHDERDVPIARRLCAERAKERDVLGRVRQMILAPDDVGDAHFQIIHHVHEMKHRLAVRTHEHEVGFEHLTIREWPRHLADHHIGNHNGRALHAKAHRALVVIGHVLVLQFLKAARINILALRLKIRPAIALARPARVGRGRAFVPVEAEPAQPFEDYVHGLLRIASLVCVLDAQDEGAAGVAGVEPVEQGGARPTDVKIPRGAGRKSNANTHVNFRDNCWMARPGLESIGQPRLKVVPAEGIEPPTKGL